MNVSVTAVKPACYGSTGSLYASVNNGKGGFTYHNSF